MKTELTAGQKAAVEKLALDLLIMGEEDGAAAMHLITTEFARAVHVRYPDLSEAKILDAVTRFTDLIWRRFRELNSTIGSEGHA
jgi:hypothetical protein